MIRMMISAAIDNDLNRFVILTYSAMSFLFLGGIQIDYEYTLLAMIVFYAISSSLEVIRVILAYHSVGANHKQIENIVLSSDVMHANFDKYLTQELYPKNVYEDLGRSLTITSMVFVLQGVLISFVVRIYPTF